MAETQDAELIRREIAVERRLLTDAVGDLRAHVGTVTDLDRRLRSRLAILAPVAFLTGFVVSGGIGATMRSLARRGRDRH
jgi:hypothetical protein